MIKIKSRSYLKMDYILLFTILFFCFICVNAISQKKWNRKYITIDYNQLAIDKSIKVKVEFFDYEFGPWGEHGYIYFLRFNYSTDGVTFLKLMDCFTENQLLNNESFIDVKVRSQDAKIELIECKSPASGTILIKDNFRRVVVTNFLKKAYLSFKWYLPSNLDIKEIKLLGSWRVTGLLCEHLLDREESYKNENRVLLNKNMESDLKQININTDAPDKSDNNQVKVYTESDAVVIRGALIGENIKVYNVSGTAQKSIVPDNETVKIKLPENQIYIVQVGQNCYKIAL